MIRWQDPWRAFDVPDKEYYFLRELRWEIRTNPEHPLYGKEPRIIGWVPGYDDFLLQLPAEEVYVYMHLTWNREDRPQFPYTQFLDGIDAVNAFLERWE